MEDSLKLLLAAIPTREDAGSTTARKYAFQADYSLSHLIELHQEAGKDYVVLFDYHDDLVVIDITQAPNSIEFYQIKSKDNGEWTIGLFTQGTKEKPSIITKMYTNKQAFPDNTRSLSFVSNAAYHFKKLKSQLECEKLSIVKGDDLSEEDIKKLVDNVQEQLELTESPAFESITDFRKTLLSNLDSKTHCVGKISEFFQAINPQNNVNCSLAYSQLIGEIKRRTVYVPPKGVAIELDVLLEKKGLSRADFTTLIESAGLYKSVEQQWNEIKAELDKVQMGATDIYKYKFAWRNLQALLLNNRNNAQLQEMQAAVDAKIPEVMANGANAGKHAYQLAEIIVNEIPLTTLDKEIRICIAIKKINDA